MARFILTRIPHTDRHCRDGSAPAAWPAPSSR